MKDSKTPPIREPAEPELGPAEPCPRTHCPIVGLGASAGGLDAFRDFLDHMPANSGMAFVLLQHLDPHHESLMPELLAKHTAMPVKTLEDGQEVEPDHVYLTPANAVITMAGCTLRLASPRRAGPRPMPIDEFFRSLAKEQGENVIGIVLSGTGTDGTLGLRAIKREGGLTMAQAPESAKYDGMPRSAVASGVVDHVLPVVQMPGVILEYMRHAHQLRGKAGTAAAQQDSLRSLARIFPLLQRKTGHDFSRYKQSTLLRRIQRRMQVTYTPSMGAYVQLLRRSPQELEELFKDLLIGVTQFFRDSEAFQALADKVLPELFRDRPAESPVRIWVPGCATGEEAFSLAILLADYMAERDLKHKVQIFATDIDSEALAFARKGEYPENVLDQIPSDRWRRFFVRHHSVCELAAPVRELCVFSLHNLIRDPPFSHLDLISCRNLLIYLEADLQNKLLPLFHYALNPSGFLFLGPSENVTARGELFRAMDKRHRIFQRRPSVLRPSLHVPSLDLDRVSRFQAPQPTPGPLAKEQTLVRSIERVLLEDLAPPCLVVNEQGEVLYFSGPVGDYLQPAAGVPSNKILNLVRKSLHLDLRASFHRAVSAHQTVVRENLLVRLGREQRHLNLIVRPLAEVSKENLYLIAFQPAPVPASSSPAASPASEARADGPAVQELENELRVTRDELQNTVEELEASNAELRSANEELLSTNEELQSTNEELQTSKEELLSLNDELQRKVEELDLAHTDLRNFVQSSQVPALFLDRQLRIRKFTPALEQLAPLQDQHIGSPLHLAAPALALPQLLAAAQEAMQSLKTLEELLWFEPKQAWFIARAMPYLASDHTVLGAVMTFTDITELKRAQEHSSQLAAIVETSTDAIVSIGPDHLIRSWNKGAERLYGWTAEEILGHPVTVLVPRELQTEFQATLARLEAGEEVAPVETVRLTKLLKAVEVSVTYSTIRNSSGAVTGIAAIARDIAERKRAEITSRLLAAIVESSDDAIISKDLNGIITSWNQGAERLYGYTAQEIIGKPVTTFIPADRQSEEPAILERIRRGERLQHFETVRQRKDGTLVDVSLMVSPVKDAQGKIVGASKITRDITERKRAERSLVEARECLAKANQDLETRVQQRTAELAESNSQLEALVYSIAHDLRAPLRAMQSFSTILLEDYGKHLDETGQGYAQRIRHSAESLDRLIFDLLAYGRLGQMALPLSTVRLESCWALALEHNAELIAQTKAVVESVEPLIPVRAHAATLAQVLTNLLNNGLRFVDAERTPRVRLRTEAKDGWVRVWVEDNGIGIEPRHYERIFGVFEQLHGKKFGGTGVGLAIVRRAVKRMGGRVGLESAVGLGTRFWFELAAGEPGFEASSLPPSPP